MEQNKNKSHISLELARIVAHICGDGHTYTAKQRRTIKELLEHPRKNKIKNVYHIRYVNTEPLLIKQFIEDVKLEFDRKVIPMKRYEYDLSGKWIYDKVRT